MFRFAILVLAGIGLGALIFGGAPSAAAGVGFLALIPLLFLLKIVFIATLFGLFARRRFRDPVNGAEFRTYWAATERPRRRTRSKPGEQRQTETDRFEEWHRMAHAKEEVAGWADEPE